MTSAEQATEALNGSRRAAIALVAFIILSIVGIAITVELTDVWVRARTDPDYQSFCAVSQGMNCETVALSDYSTVLGGPVSVWATAGFVFVIVLALLALLFRRSGFGRGFLLLFGILFGIVSLLLIYIMEFVIGSLCILCLAVDAVNFGLLAMAILAIKMGGTTFGQAIADDFRSLFRAPLRPALVAVAGVGCLAAAWAVGTRLAPEPEPLAALGQPEELLESPAEWASSNHGQQCQEQCGCQEQAEQKSVQMGLTAEGHHWVGTENAPLLVEEFTDYECPHCRQAHMMVRKLLAGRLGQIKVVHRHFPLDKSCNDKMVDQLHPRACELSRIAICAGQQGRFWEMNDFLFQHAGEIRRSRLEAPEIAKRLELNPDEFDCCMADGRVTDRIKSDLAEGRAYGVKGTPAFVIDGEVYYGKIPDEALQTTSR